LNDIHKDQTDNQGYGGHDLEINNGGQPYFSYFLYILHPRNPDHDRTEDQWCDYHLDQLDKGIPKRLELDSKIRKKGPKENTDQYSHDDLKIETFKNVLHVLNDLQQFPLLLIDFKTWDSGCIC